MTSKIEVLNDFYRSFYADVGVIDADGEGLLSVNINGKNKPVTVAKKRLVLPTKQFLRDGDWTQRIAAHPLSEQINEGPSPILNATKNYCTERMKMTFANVALALIELAAEPKRHKALSTKAAKFLKSVVDTDQKTVDTLRKVLEQVSDAPEKRSITMFLKNGGKNGVLRSCQVSFPIMDDAEAPETDTFFGVKMPRKTKDKALIVALFEYILGDKAEREEYTQSSNDSDAPYFHSLLRSFNALAIRFNSLIEVHKAGCPQLAPLMFNLEWAEQLNDFAEFARKYGVSAPMLPGNSGVDVDAVEEPVAVNPSAYETDGEDLGRKDLDLPWDEKPNDDGRRMGYDRERSRDERPAPRQEREPAVRDDGVPRRSLADVLGRNRNDRDREPERFNSRSSRDSGRDRDRGGFGGGSGRRNW